MRFPGRDYPHRGLCAYCVIGVLITGAILSAQSVLFVPQTEIAVGVGPVSLAIGEFDGDGKPDLAVANARSTTITLLRGLGNGFFQRLTDQAVGIARSAWRPAISTVIRGWIWSSQILLPTPSLCRSGMVMERFGLAPA